MTISIVPSLEVVQREPSISAGLTPQIIWPTMLLGDHGYVESDVVWFPEEDMHRERYRRGIGGAMSPAFRSAARNARERIWVVDDYLLTSDESVERLGEMLFDTGATDIRLATAENAGARDWAIYLRGLEQDLQNRNPSGVPICVRILLNLRKAQMRDLPEIHDRFAIIDDVLWHCGATIGGLHNAINAMTFGWSARDTKAITFFERLWNVLENDDAGNR
jgi:hypothetical protein